MAMGGVGEAMLLGAAMGGGSAALTGGDPLKGALLGGLTGGAGAGISGALAGGAEAGTLASTLGTEAATGAGIDTLAAQNIANNPGLYPPGSTLPGNATMFMPSSTPGVTTTLPSAAPAENFAWNSVTRANEIIPNTVTSAATPNAYTIPSAGSNVVPTTPGAPQTFGEGAAKFAQNPLASLKANPFTTAAAGVAGAVGARRDPYSPEEYNGPLKRFKFNPDTYQPSFFAAEGGIATLASGGYDRMVGEEPMYTSNLARGGISDLGSYSDGGRMLRGPGDGMSDSIPASISGKRPARLADGEFVVPADVVSHLGNGSTDAGAKTLYGMMDKVRQARTGRKAQGREINPRKYMPA